MTDIDPAFQAPENTPTDPRDQENVESNSQSPLVESSISSTDPTHTAAPLIASTNSNADKDAAPNQPHEDLRPEQTQLTYEDNNSSIRPGSSLDWAGESSLSPGSNNNSESLIEDVTQEPEAKRRKLDGTEGTPQLGTGRTGSTARTMEATHDSNISPAVPKALQQTASASESDITGEESSQMDIDTVENTGGTVEGWSSTGDTPLYSPAIDNPNTSTAVPVSLQETAGTTERDISGEKFSSQFPGPYQSRETANPQEAATEEEYSYYSTDNVTESYPEEERYPSYSHANYSSHAVPEMYLEQEERPTSSLNIDFTTKPKLVAKASREYCHDPENFLRGCMWSPEGSCLMTNSEDNILRFYSLQDFEDEKEPRSVREVTPVQKIQERELIYDYCWNPNIRGACDDEDCFVLTTCRDMPIHLWLCNGELRATYLAYDDVDEVTPAYCLAVSGDGRQIYSGFNKTIRIFDTDRPGRQCDKRVTYGPMHVDEWGRRIKGKKKKAGQPGIISCIALHPTDESFFAAGTYSSSIGLYPREVREPCMARLQGQKGGVTCLRFSPDGTKLYSGGRMDNEIICWDVRQLNNILCVFSAERLVNTNQRIYFDLDRTGQFMVSGSCDGQVTVWDTTLTPWTSQHGPVLEPVASFGLHDDAVNGVSLHPDQPLLATASGRRHFPLPSVDSSSDSDSDSSGVKEGKDFSVRFWRLHSQQLDTSTTEICSEQG